APAAWLSQQIATGNIRVLRFLDTREAAAELLRLFITGHDDFDTYIGILSSQYRKQLLPVMEQGLTVPDQPVSQRYLTLLVELAAPESPQQKQNEYAARLAASLRLKEPKARAVSLATLLSVGAQGGPKLPWMRDVVPLLAADFHSLPVQSQSSLLEYRWELI